MSTNPSDPFDNPNANRSPANQGFGQPNYAQDDFAQPPRKTGGKGLWIGCGIAGLLGVLLCCGGFGMLGYFGLNVMGDMVQAEVENSPTVIEHFGDIESMSMNFTATAEEAQNVPPGEGSPLVFDVRGSKGSGRIVARQSPGAQGIESAVLITSTGQRFPIELSSGPASDLDDIELELKELEFNEPIQSGPAK